MALTTARIFSPVGGHPNKSQWQKLSESYRKDDLAIKNLLNEKILKEFVDSLTYFISKIICSIEFYAAVPRWRWSCSSLEWNSEIDL